jgi:hypothetical protein
VTVRFFSNSAHPYVGCPYPQLVKQQPAIAFRDQEQSRQFSLAFLGNFLFQQIQQSFFYTLP